MKPECRTRVSTVLGAPVTDAQAALLDQRIEAGMRAKSREMGLTAWSKLSPGERIVAGAEFAAAEIEAQGAEAAPTYDQREASQVSVIAEGLTQGWSREDIRAAVDALRAAKGQPAVEDNVFRVQLTAARKKLGMEMQQQRETSQRDLLIEYRDLVGEGVTPQEAQSELAIRYDYDGFGAVATALTRIRNTIREARTAGTLDTLSGDWSVSVDELEAFADETQQKRGRAPSGKVERIAALAAKGKTPAIIAKQVGVSTNTVNVHLGNVRRVQEALAAGRTPEEIASEAKAAGRRSITKAFVTRAQAMPVVPKAGAVILDQGTDPVRSARAEGYAGSNTGEAVEWLRAVAKGLDMSTEARMARAREMGFDTSRALYHGTTHDFREFGGAPNIESHHGAGAYLSSSPADIGRNYATPKGADLTNRIEQRAERIQQELEDAVQDGVDRAVLKKYGVTEGQVTERTGSGLPKVEALARELARKELAGPNEGLSIPVYPRVRAPVVVNGGTSPSGLRSQQAPAKPSARPTRWDFETVYDEAGEDVISEGGPALDLVEATRSALAATGMPDKYAEDVLGPLQERIFEDAGIDADAFERIMRNEGATVIDYESSSGQVIQEVYRAMGADGIVLKNAEREFPRMGMDADTDHYVIFEPRNIRSIHAAFDPDFKDSANLLAQGTGTVRGDFTAWRKERDGLDQFRIRMYAARNMSTFLHESAHFFLEVMDMLSAESAEVDGMMNGVRGWLDTQQQVLVKEMRAAAATARVMARTDPGFAESLPDIEEAEALAEADPSVFAKVWARDSDLDVSPDVLKELRRQGHELFARTFEAHLMTGNAPSLSLRDAFAAFRRWLISWYNDIRGIERQGGRTALSPEISAVFDRMLASDQEIALARAAQGIDRPYTQQQLGMDDARYARYLANWNAAMETAQDDLRAELMQQHIRSKQRWWKRETARFRRTVTLEVNGYREYRAADWLATGKWMDGVADAREAQPAATPDYLEMQEAERDRARREREFLERMRRPPQTPEEIAQDALRRAGGDTFTPQIGGPVRPIGEGMSFLQTASIRRGKETLRKYGLDPDKTYKTRQVAAALEARQRAKYGSIDPKDRSEEAARRIANWMAEEVQFEMENPGASGVGWYSEKYQRALDAFGAVFPELKTDKSARDIFTVLMAVTSDGQKVIPNFAQAADIYGAFRETGQFTTSRGHQRQASILNNLQKLQQMHDKHGADGMRDNLLQERTVSELNKLAREMDIQFSTSYQAHIRLPMAALILGPKLGAFYANLMGSHGYLTMDRWWTRTINRYRGTLLTSATQTALDSFKALIKKPELSNDEVLSAVIAPRNALLDRNFKTRLALILGKSEPGKKEEKAEWMERARALDTREAMDAALESAARSLETKTKKKRTKIVEDEDGNEIEVPLLDAEAQKIAADLRSQIGIATTDSLLYEHSVERAANTIHKAAFENIEDQPFNASDRTFMIEAVELAQKTLKRRGHDISIADIQAVLWYYEKRLYGELGARQSADVSYEEAAQKVVAAIQGGVDLAGRSDLGSGEQDTAGAFDPGSGDFAPEEGLGAGRYGGGTTFQQFVPAETDPEALEEALQALAAGVDPETVRRTYGVFEHPDGSMRIEISDQDATLISAARYENLQKSGRIAFDDAVANGTNLTGDIDTDDIADAVHAGAEEFRTRAKLNTLIEHPELFARLPWLADVDVIFWGALTGMGGEGTAVPAKFDGSTKPFILVATHDVVPANRMPDVALSLLMHETKHLIQARYLWEVGGDPQTARHYFNLMTPEDQKFLAAVMVATGFNPNDDFHLYKWLRGEMDAFDVEARLRFTDEQRRAIPPRALLVPSIPTFRWTQADWDAMEAVLGAKMSRRMASIRDPDPAPIFYSALERAIRSLPEETEKTALGWKRWLVEPSRVEKSTVRDKATNKVVLGEDGKPIVKERTVPEVIRTGLTKGELEWTGVEEFLDAQEGAVTRDALLAFVRANGVRVEETVLGDVGVEGRDRLDAIQRELLPLIEAEQRNQSDINAMVFDENGSIRNETPAQKAEREALIERGVDLRRKIRVLQNEQAQISGGSQTKWSSYTLPGGEGYRELLLRLPPTDVSVPQFAVLRPDGHVYGTWTDARAAEMQAQRIGGSVQSRPSATVEGGYRSSHWDEPNVLAHIRFKERVDSEGRRTLAIEEVQSDWHQAGREKGYKTADRDKAVERAENALKLATETLAKEDKRTLKIITGYDSLEAARSDANYNRNALHAFRNRDENWLKAYDEVKRLETELRSVRTVGTVPDAPFKDNKWAALALKRMIRWAASEGFDSISWIPGDVAVERFGVERVVGMASITRDGAGYIVYLEDPQGQAIRNLPGMARAEYGQFSMSADKVRELVGKELGDKMIAAADAKQPGKFADFKGQDLKIGGDGMRAFYDRILVNIANDLGKKYGAKVATVDVHMPLTGERATRPSNNPPETLHALPITPALRDAALGGLPLFQREKEPDPAIEPKPEGLERMKLDKAQVEEIYGEEVAQALKPYLTGSGENRAYAAQIAEDITEARKKAPRGRRLWVWIRDQGGIADDDARDMIDGSRKFPGLYRKDGRTIDELARAAVETGFLDKQVDDEGYVVPVDVEAFRDMLRRDLAGDEQRSAQFAGEREANAAGSEVLAQYEAMGVDTSLTGEALLRSIMEAFKGERLGTDIDDAAAAFGFSSGDELVQALLNLPAKADVITERTEAAMAREYGDDFMDPDALAEEAKRAAHAEAQGRSLEVELEAMARLSGGRARAMGAAARDIAERQLQAMTIRQVLSPDQFLAAERRFGLAAQRALAAGDTAGATEAKRRQLVSWHLYRAVRAVGDRVEKNLTRWARLASNPTTRKAIAPEHLDQIDAILERLDLKSSTQAKERASQAQWFMAVEEAGLSGMLAVDPETLAQIGAKPVRTMTVAEFQDVADAIANIEHIGRNAGKFLAAQRQQALQERIDAAAEQMNSLPALEGQTTNMAPTAGDKIAERWRQWHADLTRPEFLFRLLDGNQDNGPVWNLLFRPFADAENYETSLRRAMTAEMDRIFAVYTPKERAELYSRHMLVSELGQGQWTKQNLLALALNWGNDGNRAAVLAGTGWTPQQVEMALSRLTQKDWQVVENVWRAVDRLWPQIAEQERVLTGIVPEKVQGIDVITPFGVIKGGYYPLKYDARRSLKVSDREGAQTVQEMFGARFTRAATRKGHTKERVGSGGLPVRLELDVLAEHVANVTHDLAFRKAVIDANRIIANPVFEAALVRVAGREHAGKLKDWLRSVAVDQPEPTTLADKVLSRIRRNTSVVAMGYRVSTALTQVAGFVNLIPRVGAVPLLGAIRKLYANPFATARTWEMISAKSEYMRSRPQSLDRDVRELLAKMEKRGPVSFVQRHAFDLIAAMDWFVASAGWTAAYDLAINGKVAGIQSGNEIDAVAHADSVIRMTQSAGAPKDLSAVMRGSELMKQLTGFYSFLSVYYNQVNVEQFGGMRAGKVPFHIFVRNMFVISILGPLLTALIAGRFEPKDDEDEEDRNRRIAMELLAFQVAGVPGLRDVAAAGLQDYTYAMSPSAAAIKTMTEGSETAFDVLSGEPVTEADAKRMANALGYAAGLPTGQAWTTGDYLVDLAEGEEDPANDPGDALREAFVSDRR